MPWPAIAPSGRMLPSPTCGRPDSVPCSAAEGAASATAPDSVAARAPRPTVRTVRSVPPPTSPAPRGPPPLRESRRAGELPAPHPAPVSSSMRGIATRTEATSRAVVSPDMCLRPVETFSVAALVDHIAMIDHDVALGSAVLGLPVSDHPGVAAPVHICPPMLESHRVPTSSLARFQY